MIYIPQTHKELESLEGKLVTVLRAHNLVLPIVSVFYTAQNSKYELMRKLDESIDCYKINRDSVIFDIRGIKSKGNIVREVYGNDEFENPDKKAFLERKRFLKKHKMWKYLWGQDLKLD